MQTKIRILEAPVMTTFKYGSEVKYDVKHGDEYV